MICIEVIGFRCAIKSIKVVPPEQKCRSSVDYAMAWNLRGPTYKCLSYVNAWCVRSPDLYYPASPQCVQDFRSWNLRKENTPRTIWRQTSQRWSSIYRL